MKVKIRGLVPFAFATALAAATARAEAPGKTLGPGRYDRDNPAIGVVNEDVPPELASVSFYPPVPKAGSPLFVAAEIEVDPDESENVVEEARILYRLNDEADWRSVEMTRSASNARLWMGEIPAQEKGASIETAIHARDSAGNRAMEIPESEASWPPDPRRLFLVSEDGADVVAPYPASMDVVRFYIGRDGRDHLIVLAKFADKLEKSTREIFAHAYGAGVVCPVRHGERDINIELGSFPKAVMYLPMMRLQGYYKNIESMGAAPDADIDVKASGSQIAMRADLDEVCPPEERTDGFKIFYAAGLMNVKDGGDPEAVDVTPMAMIYARSHRFTVE